MSARTTGRDGVLVLDKPAGPSSHEIVGWVRHVLGERRVGHCGTLDPAATGVLVVCVGEATKLVAWLTDDDKRYAASIVLGRSTTTADAAGETLCEANVSASQLSQAAAALPQLCGPLELSPPRVSAVRVDGVRAHARARAGEAFELPPRTMRVHAADLVGIDPATHSLQVVFEVGKGTYIRSLAEHLGALVGLPAHLGALRRLRTGPFTIDAAAAAGGIVCVDAGTRPDGKPRHRLAPADGAPPEVITARLSAALISPHDAAPPSWPRGRVADPERFARLCNGVDVDPAEVDFTGGAPALGPDTVVLVAGPEPSPPWVIARVDAGAGRLRPIRVLGPTAPAHPELPREA